jgi:hypothetical protein
LYHDLRQVLRMPQENGDGSGSSVPECWTAEEVSALLVADLQVKRSKPNNQRWRRIAEVVATRSPEQCTKTSNVAIPSGTVHAVKVHWW